MHWWFTQNMNGSISIQNPPKIFSADVAIFNSIKASAPAMIGNISSKELSWNRYIRWTKASNQKNPKWTGVQKVSSIDTLPKFYLFFSIVCPNQNLTLLIHLAIVSWISDAQDNHANQLNPNHVATGPGKPAGYQGKGDKDDLDNHSNQLNPNSKGGQDQSATQINPNKDVSVPTGKESIGKDNSANQLNETVSTKRFHATQWRKFRFNIEIAYLYNIHQVKLYRNSL